MYNNFFPAERRDKIKEKLCLPSADIMFGRSTDSLC